MFRSWRTDRYRPIDTRDQMQSDDSTTPADLSDSTDPTAIDAPTDTDAKRVALAFSGGLDTTVCVPLLEEGYGYEEVIGVTVDVGQPDEEFEEARETDVGKGVGGVDDVVLQVEGLGGLAGFFELLVGLADVDGDADHLLVAVLLL
jgi:hypothetical protein